MTTTNNVARITSLHSHLQCAVHVATPFGCRLSTGPVDVAMGQTEQLVLEEKENGGLKRMLVLKTRESGNLSKSIKKRRKK